MQQTLNETLDKLDGLLDHYCIEEPRRSALWYYARGNRKLINDAFPTPTSFLLVPVAIRAELMFAEQLYEENLIRAGLSKIITQNKLLLFLMHYGNNNDRMFDIVRDMDLFRFFVMQIVDCKILNDEEKFQPDKSKANKQCIVGLLVVLFRTGVFKETYPHERGSLKTVTLQDVMTFGEKLFEFGSIDACRKKLDLCVERALYRIPGLKKFDEQNKKNHLKY